VQPTVSMSATSAVVAVSGPMIVFLSCVVGFLPAPIRMPIAASVAERPRAQMLESVALCKSRATPASVWAVSASIRCRLVHLPLRDTHVIESERTAVGKHGADLWKPVVLRSLRHDAGHWRSHSVRASSRTI
jgi:hypothetical protein